MVCRSDGAYAHKRRIFCLDSTSIPQRTQTEQMKRSPPAQLHFYSSWCSTSSKTWCAKDDFMYGCTYGSKSLKLLSRCLVHIQQVRLFFCLLVVVRQNSTVIGRCTLAKLVWRVGVCTNISGLQRYIGTKVFFHFLCMFRIVFVFCVVIGAISSDYSLLTRIIIGLHSTKQGKCLRADVP